ncbi:MAG: hypothetical protein MUF15_12290 [Acidobacteria bacterium]|jgi:hypothetical protein|nr:hypothetical protein [Acidobacteriota bacterium]
MEIPGELTSILKQLSQVNIDFNEFVSRNPDSLKSISFEGMKATGDSYKLQAWPTFISPQTKALFLETSVKVFNLVKSIPARFFANDPNRAAAYYEQPTAVVNVQLEGINDARLAGIVGRVDFMLSPPGLKCLELNISTYTIGWQYPVWQSLYLNTPVIDKFLKEYRVKINNENYPGLFLEHMIRLASPLAGPQLNVAMVMEGYSEDNQDKNPFLENLKQLYPAKLACSGLPGQLFMCDFPHLEYSDNKVYYHGHRVHGLIELCHGIMAPGVMKAFTSGNICLLNGPVTGLLSNKLNLALLSEHEDADLFTAEEKETIKTYIPWTRKIIPGETLYKGEKIQMENFLIANKDKLVIKPSLGLGGQQVCIGQAIFRKEWEYIVSTALRKRTFLVQELVEAPRFLYRSGEEGCAFHDTVWGVWLLGSQYGASMVRVLPAGKGRKVVNAAQGAEVSAVFEVDK